MSEGAPNTDIVRGPREDFANAHEADAAPARWRQIFTQQARSILGLKYKAQRMCHAIAVYLVFVFCQLFMIPTAHAVSCGPLTPSPEGVVSIIEFVADADTGSCTTVYALQDDGASGRASAPDNGLAFGFLSFPPRSTELDFAVVSFDSGVATLTLPSATSPDLGFTPGDATRSLQLTRDLVYGGGWTARGGNTPDIVDGWSETNVTVAGVAYKILISGIN